MISLTRRYSLNGEESEITIIRGYKGDYFNPADHDLSAYIVRDLGLDSNIAASAGVASTTSYSSDTAIIKGS
jgi:hypothetical protein